VRLFNINTDISNIYRQLAVRGRRGAPFVTANAAPAA
jgi:hypothetical protein